MVVASADDYCRGVECPCGSCAGAAEAACTIIERVLATVAGVLDTDEPRHAGVIIEVDACAKGIAVMQHMCTVMAVARQLALRTG